MARRLKECGYEISAVYDLNAAAATKKQYDRMVSEGLGDLDKSGVAELTFASRRGRVTGGGGAHAASAPPGETT